MLLNYLVIYYQPITQCFLTYFTIIINLYVASLLLTNFPFFTYLLLTRYVSWAHENASKALGLFIYVGMYLSIYLSIYL